MEPFKSPDSLKGLTDPYPDPQELLEAARSGGEPARIALARLWLSEGIPYAFRCCPVIYESVRSWLSAQLGVHAKEISMVGSARLGKSLAPEKQKLGKPFDENSDLDIFIVSNCLFESLREDFCRWSLDFESGKLTPRDSCEAKYWKDNNARGPRLILRGFIDVNMIPNFSDYSTVRKIKDAMWLLVEKLKITTNAPQPKEASVRCYSSWDSFVQQVSLNLKPKEPER